MILISNKTNQKMSNIVLITSAENDLECKHRSHLISINAKNDGNCFTSIGINAATSTTAGGVFIMECIVLTMYQNHF